MNGVAVRRDGTAARASETRVALRWRDIGVRDHVNQSVYQVLLEEARADLLAPLGDFEYVIAHIEFDFFHEVRRGHGHVDIELSIAEIGCSSFTVEHRLRLPDGTLAAGGTTVIVAWDHAARCSRPLRESERTALVAHYLAA